MTVAVISPQQLAEPCRRGELFDLITVRTAPKITSTAPKITSTDSSMRAVARCQARSWFYRRRA